MKVSASTFSGFGLIGTQWLTMLAVAEC